MSVEPAERELLKSLAYKKSKEWLFIHPEYRPNIWERLRWFYYLYLYKKGWPVAYISGHKEFYGLDFLVNRYTLIPRPETEMLIDEAVKIIELTDPTPYPSPKRGGTEGGVLLIDIGAGTGCIPISIIKTLKSRRSDVAIGVPNLLRDAGRDPDARVGIPSLPRDIKTIQQKNNETMKQSSNETIGGDPSHSFGMTVVAVDISRGALRVAKKNAKLHKVNINFVHGNLLSSLTKYLISNIQYFNVVITANLPYLTAEQFKSEPSIQREPRLALVADNEDGLSLYEKLFQQIQSLLLIANCSLLILLEIDPRQVEGMKKLTRQYLPDFSCEIKKDLNGFDRIIGIRY